MNRTWSDLTALNGNIAGARVAFEDACEKLFRKIHSNKHVSQVSVKNGDGGIDIFIGELGIEPITVIQCKFFINTFEVSQKKQIAKSFETSIKSPKYVLGEWILCIPRVIDIDENSWWFKWKHSKLKKYSKDHDFIKIYNGNELIDLLKSTNLYNNVFKIEDSIKIAEIHDILLKKNSPIESLFLDPKLILFNNYSFKCEPYYIERNSDVLFIKSLKINNVWIYGDSGSGKTVMVNRNLIKNNIEYCYCDLSPIDINNSNQVLEEIICKIEEKVCRERNLQISNNIKQIADLLCRSKMKEIIIVVDELSVHEKSLFKDISQSLINLVVHYYNLDNSSSLKFVVSTIFNPNQLIENTSKASDHFQYINCNEWEKSIAQLYDIISKSLNLDLDLALFKNEILMASENSPRRLKAIFRNIYSLEDFSEETIHKSIKTTTLNMVGQ